MVALMAVANLSPIIGFTRYPELFRSIIAGLESYERSIPCVGGSIHLTYFDNLAYDGKALTEVAKPVKEQPPSSFDAFRDRMVRQLRHLFSNAADDARARAFIPLTTVSTGYDSTTVSALAIAAGATDSITIANSRSGDIDSGEPIAKHLGLSCTEVSREAWRQETDCESIFLSSDAKGEDVYFAGFGDKLAGRLLLTGYCGTRVLKTRAGLSFNFERTDQSGLSHTEARLHLGYVHCPALFIAGRDTQSLRHISLSDEMRPWDIGGDYSSPIARRLLEEAGVPREMFGMKKQAASVLIQDRREFLSERSKENYARWFEENFARSGRLRERLRSLQVDAVAQLARVLTWSAAIGHRVLPLPILRRIANSVRLNELAHRDPRFDHLFAWSVQKTVKRYRTGPSEGV
ncbi:MAG: hypothetical protein AAFU85_22805 [Planctomycetota bacterium]